MQTRIGIYCNRLIEAGWLAALVLTPALFNVYSSRVFEPDKLTVLRCVVAVMVAAWLIKTIDSGMPRAWSFVRFRSLIAANPLSGPAILFGSVYVITTVTSIAPSTSFWGSYQRLQGTLNGLCYISLFFLVGSHLRNRIQVERVIQTIIATGYVVSLYGIAQHFHVDPLPWGGDVATRVTSSLGNAIFLGAYLVMAIPLALSRLLGSLHAILSSDDSAAAKTLLGGKRVLTAAYYAFALCVQLAATYYTFSRGPWLALCVGLFVFALLTTLRLIRNRRKAIFAASLLGFGSFISVCLLILLNLSPSPLADLKSQSRLFERLGSIGDTDSGTNRVRVLIWFGDGVGSGNMGLITANPLRTLIGYGPEMMYLAYSPYYPPGLAQLEQRNASPDRSHNDFLDYMVTMGVAGLASYLLVIAVFFVSGARLLWRTREPWQELLLIALLSAIAAHLVETFFGIAIASTRTYFWTYLAVTMGIWSMHRATSVQPGELSHPTNMTLPLKEMVPVFAGGSRSSRLERVAEEPRSHRARNRVPAAQFGASNGSHPTSIYSTRETLDGPGLRGGVWPLIVYLILTVTATSIQLAGQFGQEVDPPLLVAGWYLWMLVGLAAGANWVSGGLAWSLLTREATGKRAGRSPSGSARSLKYLGHILIVGITLWISMFHFLPSITADVFFKRGQTYDALRRFDVSIASYLQSIRFQPQQDYYYLFLGRAYLEMAPAQPAVESTISPPSQVEDLFRNGTRSLGGVGTEGLFRSAQVSLKTAHDLSPLNTDNAANLGRLHRFWGERTPDASLRQQRFDSAEQAYREAVGLSPHAAHLFDEWGLLYHVQGRFDLATEKYREALALDKEYYITYIYLGDTFLAQNRLPEAAGYYEQALKRNPNVAGVYTALGYINHQMGKPHEALYYYMRAVDLAPGDMSSHRNLAVAYRDLNLLPQSLAEAEMALRLAPPEQQEPIRQYIGQLRQYLR